MTEPRERYRIEFTVLPDRAPAVMRLRAMLKRALRDLNLRCTRAVRIDEHGVEITLGGRGSETTMG